MKPRVYLAGPVTGLSYHEANEWRLKVQRVLLPEIEAVNPLRGKEYLDSQIGPIEPSPQDGFCTDEAIIMRDYNDLRRSDVVLANLAIDHPADHPISVGTLFELAWAWEQRKIIVTVGGSDSLYDHPFVRHAITYAAMDLPDAIDYIKSALLP